jgi:hypothetical protein
VGNDGTPLSVGWREELGVIRSLSSFTIEQTKTVPGIKKQGCPSLPVSIKS